MVGMQQLDTELASLQLLDTSGNRVRFGDLWANQTTVLVWLRHYR